MDVRREIKELRQQMATDFEFQALAMKDMGLRVRTGFSDMAKRMEGISRQMESIGREMEERFNQVEGRMRLQEQRFSKVLVAVEDSLDDWRPEIEQIKARLDRLERKADPAA